MILVLIPGDFLSSVYLTIFFSWNFIYLFIYILNFLEQGNIVIGHWFTVLLIVLFEYSVFVEAEWRI